MLCQRPAERCDGQCRDGQRLGDAADPQECDGHRLPEGAGMRHPRQGPHCQRRHRGAEQRGRHPVPLHRHADLRDRRQNLPTAELLRS